MESFVFSWKLFFGKFRRTPRRHPWQNWIFLANHCFLGKTMKIYEIYIHPKNFFFKMFFRSLKVRFPHPRRKRLPTSGFSSFKISIQCQKGFFSEKNLLSQNVFLETWTAVLTNLLKLIRRETLTFPSLPKRRKTLFVTKFPARTVPLYT